MPMPILSSGPSRTALILASTALLAGACTIGSGESDTDTTTTAGSGSESATSGSATGTGSDGSMSSTGGSTEGTSDSSTGTGTTDTTTAGSTGGVECDLEAIACEQAEIGGELFIDCGVVNPWDSSGEEWQTARECALAAVADEKAFKLVTWLQGIDSSVGYAYVGFEGESYGISRYLYDSYPPAGVTVSSCASLTAEESCIAAVDQICLTCVDAGPNSQFCGGE